MKPRLILCILAILSFIQSAAVAGYPMQPCGKRHPGICNAAIAVRGCGVAHPGDCKTEIAGRFKRTVHAVAGVAQPVIMPVQPGVVVMPGQHQQLVPINQGQQAVHNTTPGLHRIPGLKYVGHHGGVPILVGVSYAGNLAITTTPEGLIRGLSGQTNPTNPASITGSFYVQGPGTTSGY